MALDEIRHSLIVIAVPVTMIRIVGLRCDDETLLLTPNMNASDGIQHQRVAEQPVVDTLSTGRKVYQRLDVVLFVDGEVNLSVVGALMKLCTEIRY